MRFVQRSIARLAVPLLAVAAGDCRDVLAPVAGHCAEPAPLLGRPDPAAPDFIVVYRDGVDPVIETDRLASRYDFTPAYVYTAALHGFAATLTADAVAGVRCEQSVAYVEHDAVVHVD